MLKGRLLVAQEFYPERTKECKKNAKWWFRLSYHSDLSDIQGVITESGYDSRKFAVEEARAMAKATNIVIENGGDQYV